MNNSVIAFALGVSIGAGVAWYIAKSKYEALANEEIESVKAAFAADYEKQTVAQDSESVKDISEKKPVTVEHSDSIRKPESIKEYAERIKNGTNYAACSKEECNDIPDKATVDGPYKIDNDEVGNLDDYEVIELNLYNNDILCDDMDERMTEQDIRDTVGRDYLELCPEGVDQLCIRNDEKRCDYSIVRCDEDYEGE